MSQITVEFEFEIGEIVFFKAADHNSAVRPRTYQIMERLAQECHGGIQRAYVLVGSREWVPELALSREEPLYRPESQQTIDAKCTESRARSATYRATNDPQTNDE